MKKTNKILIAMAFATAGVQPAIAGTDIDLIPGVDLNVYGSLRVAAESVRPNDINDYTATRDAYSRVGFKASFSLTDSLTASIVHEVPLDLANGDARTPDGRTENVRVSKFQLSGDWGNLWVGQDWLPYYNNISYKVDLFDSYYSGFATFAPFRRGDSIGFNTTVAGLYVASVYSKGDVNDRQSNGSTLDDRWQLALSKSFDNLTIAAAVDNLDDANNTTYYGLGLGYTVGSWYIGAKYETIDSDVTTNGAFNEDGNDVYNLFASYTTGKHTFSAMVAEFEGFGGDIFHGGWRYQYTPSTRFFVEYYDEETVGAIAPKRDSTLSGDRSFSQFSSGGGSAVTAGIRFDF